MLTYSSDCSMPRLYLNGIAVINARASRTPRIVFCHLQAFRIFGWLLRTEAECAGVAVTLQAFFVSGRGHSPFWGLAVVGSPFRKLSVWYLHWATTASYKLLYNLSLISSCCMTATYYHRRETNHKQHGSNVKPVVQWSILAYRKYYAGAY